VRSGGGGDVMLIARFGVSAGLTLSLDQDQDQDRDHDHFKNDQDQSDRRFDD